ncbi:spindle assembly checkpoint component MAD1 [Zopfia rhizophila CBS 207.26]|uniref:Spindle assembly checkpoint component MAD1 n=1 Tax=Zopfia rhizophila CBS 207.26 TaxID=1314779 RepID=A0A6A6EYM5_9PEZI|nr:spindle assembly checkpoint component MAD1 [Zopfia rhizophila CBS 207.26]
MASRKQSQPTFNIFTGGASSPTPPPFRETLRASHTVRPADPVNEDLRAQINTLRYELDTIKQESEMTKLQHQQEIREIQNRSEADFRRAQQAETSSKSAATKYDALVRELSEVQTRSANERQGLERRLRNSQEKAQQLQEEADEAKEDLATSLRENEHKFNALRTEHNSLKATVDEIRADLDAKASALQTSQRKLSQKEAEVGELESEVLRLRAVTGDAETLGVIKRELSEQVAHIKKLEALNREQFAELKQYRKQRKSIEVVEEEKRSLETQLRIMKDLQRELSESQLRRQVLEDERNSWAAYLESQDTSQDDMRFETPEDLARAFIRERLETADLAYQLGQIKPELSVRDQRIQTLEDEKNKLRAEIEKLKALGRGASAGDSKIRARLERQKALLTKEIDFLRAQLKNFDDEEREMQPESHDAAKSARIKELENLVDETRKEVEALLKDLSATNSRLTVAAGQKRQLDTDDVEERVGELRRKNRSLQDELTESQKRIKVLEADYKTQLSQPKSLKASSRTRVLELKSNPTADAEALKLSTVRTLREANAELLARLEGQNPAPNSVPLATLTATKDEMTELAHTVAEREKRIKRLKQIWTAKSLEFREAVASVLGWKLDFMPNGRVRVTSMFYPGDEETGENSIVFDGENGTMKVSGGPQSAFANEIRDLITFWVEERKEIPCFLAAMTLEFWERTTRAAR